MWEQKYPSLKHVIHDVTPMIELLRAHPTYELEARFGVVNPNTGRFCTGVDRATIDRIISMVQNSSYVITINNQWIEEHDVFYTHNETNFRTRVEFNNETMQVTPTTIVKKNIENQTFLNTTNYLRTNNMDVRVSLKDEITVTKLPLSVIPTQVRIKQKKRFLTECKRWAFDFSMSWSGTAKTEAENKQMTCDPVFEIECELIDHSYMNDRDNEHVAVSLLLKMLDFMDSNTILVKYSAEMGSHASCGA